MQVRRLQELIDNVSELSNWAYKDAVEEIQKIGDKIAETARNEAPVRTGKLKASIHSEPTPTGCKVLADTSYAGYVNSGTRKMAARPFMTNAILDASNQIVSKIKDRMD